MKLIGILDSPYVRRVAISLRCLSLPYEHLAISVFGDFEQFHAINPVVKAPTLVCDDGGMLMDSTLILDYAETLAAPRSLMPAGRAERQRALRLIGLALAACDKCVQVYYERRLRPPEIRHAPWVERATAQALAAFAALETDLLERPLAVTEDSLGQPAISAAVVWNFTCQTVPEVARMADVPALRALSDQAEALPVFAAVPHGPPPQAAKAAG